jgi:DNA-binding IscR family transcriptional regulator
MTLPLTKRESYLYYTILRVVQEKDSARLPLSDITARSRIKGRVFSGVYSSLVRKGLIRSEKDQVILL